MSIKSTSKDFTVHTLQ